MKQDRPRYRFIPGQYVHVRGWPFYDTVLISEIDKSWWWPTYICVDINGNPWRISQLELSSKPLNSK